MDYELTLEGPQKIKAFDLLRTRYEYGGESITEICAEEGYAILDLQNYASLHGWIRIEDPEYEDSEAVDKFYATARAQLTILVTRRALSLWPKIVALEDATINKTIEAIHAVDVNDTDRSSGAEISRLSKILSSLVSTSTLYTQAVAAPALKEANFVELMKTIEPKTLEEATSMLKERGIPSPLAGLIETPFDKDDQ